jgi:hypothetical protein
MSNSNRDAPPRSKAGVPVPLREASDDWQTTGVDLREPPTQFVRDRDDYLGETALDVGRQTSAAEHELFVSCDPAPAMQQQFEYFRPEFIAVHDIATSSSRKLLGGLASASGRATQKLVIRRQGYGTALATVHFVELHTAAGTNLRMYSTDCETEPAWRQDLAHMLLAFSRLGVIMVGDLKPNEMALALDQMRDSMLRGGLWRNRQLLLLPLGSASSLVSHGMELARGSDVNVRTTPQIARAADAWGFISGAWNRLTDKNPSMGGAVPALGELSATAGTQTAARIGEPSPAAAAVQASPKTASSAPASATVSPTATAGILRRYVRQISELSGVIGCTVFDAANGSRVAHAGSGPSAADLAQHGVEMLAAIAKASNALGLGRALPEAAISLESHHLLLRAVPLHPGLALHVVLDKARANLTLVRLQVLRMDTLFDEMN